MTANDMQFIQDQIGYRFKNLDLLRQAFVRRSYSEENGGENNEVLEFIGDKVLDFVIVKLLAEIHGRYAGDQEGFDPDRDYDEFTCEYREGKLTEIKKSLVEKKMLAHRLDVLGFADFLIMGKGDAKNNVAEQDSVREDLFEAIVGAAALDCDWDLDEIQDIVEVMLDPEGELSEDPEKNPVRIIQEWTLKHSGSVPMYHFEKASYQSTWYYPFRGVSQSVDPMPRGDIGKLQFCCLLKIDDSLPVFRGYGKSKNEARRSVCKLAYDYLADKGLLSSIRDEIPDPNRAAAINQLETLARRGYFSVPKYKFSLRYDTVGNTVWSAECIIDGCAKRFGGKASSKKEAKKSAAYAMLKYVLAGRGSIKRR